MISCFVLRQARSSINRNRGRREMTNKERIIELLDSVPDYKMGYVLAYVQGITADEESDDIFWQRMLEKCEDELDIS